MTLFDKGAFYRPGQPWLFPEAEKPSGGNVERSRAGLEPELTRQSRSAQKILDRLRDGPALAAELVACGGGYRYGARLLELRRAGHNIEAIHKGEGLWEYRLVLP